MSLPDLEEDKRTVATENASTTNRKLFFHDPEDTEREELERERRIYGAAEAASITGNFSIAFWDELS